MRQEVASSGAHQGGDRMWLSLSVGFELLLPSAAAEAGSVYIETKVGVNLQSLALPLCVIVDLEETPSGYEG